MNRFHVHLNVTDLAASIRFYSALFAAEPSVRKADYAKWLLDDPRVNFAISDTGRAPGIDHLGIQAGSEAELAELGQRLRDADSPLEPEPGAVCCYARSDKLWSHDPQGTRWESFHTVGEATTYYAPAADCATADREAATTSAAHRAASACCANPSACG